MPHMQEGVIADQVRDVLYGPAIVLEIQNGATDLIGRRDVR